MQVEYSKGSLTNFIKDPEALKILNRKGIKELFPVQYQTFPHIYAGKDLVAKDRTGSGKTMAFALPVITKLRQTHSFSKNHTTKFLIVLPTRQLAIQVKDQIQSLRLQDADDFTVGAVYGGSSMMEQTNMVQRGLDIIVGTPGRMIDFLQKGVIKLDDLKVTCLDEADEMLRQGFKEQIEKIFAFVKAKHQKTQNLLFSATIPDWIWDISDQYQSKDKIYIDLIKDKTVRTSKTVKHYCLGCQIYDKQLYITPLVEFFLKQKDDGKIIIFCQTKRQVDRIGNSPNLPVRAHCLHGDVKQYTRENTFRKFKNGQINCIVATNVAARGLDFPQIDLIIQMQPPKTSDEYIHRSGRTGRAGKQGICVTLFTPREIYIMQKMEAQAHIRFNFLNKSDFKKNQRREPSYKEQRRDDYGSRNSRYQGKRDQYGSRSSRYENKKESYTSRRPEHSDYQNQNQRNTNGDYMDKNTTNRVQTKQDTHKEGAKQADNFDY